MAIKYILSNYLNSQEINILDVFPQNITDMISEVKVVKLIKIYFFICDLYDHELKFYCERFSNNNEPELTDQEIMTIYLFCIFEEERFKIKQIHEFTKN